MINQSSSSLDDGPLSGITVLDFTAVVVGPVATQTLADYGADVIKIEPPGGDLLRRMGGTSNTGQLSPKFLQMNRNKRSLAIDLRTAAGQEIIRTLIRGADVMVVNMREPALIKLGLTYEAARALNDRIVHCNMMGFGRQGRYFGKPAYDSIIQGGAGVAACNERLTGTPQFVPMVLADHLVALIAVQMILLALRSRDLTERSQSVEVPMFENVASFVLQEHMGQKAFTPERGDTGDVRIFDANARPIVTSNGYICVSANTDAQVRGFFEAIGRPELIDDPRFCSVEARLEHVETFFQIRNNSLGDKPTEQWLALFDQHDVPAFQYNTLESLLDDPHLEEVGFFESLEVTGEGLVKHMKPANTFSGGGRQTPQPAPRVGEQSIEVLRDFGFADDRIHSLIAADIVIDGGPDDSET